MSDIKCSNPKIIVNPQLRQLLSRYKHYYLRGIEYHYNSRRHPSDFDFRPFSVRRNNIIVDDLSDSFVVDDNTGEIFPIYIKVPCGHCDICKVSKMNSFVHRCVLESESYSYLPWFVTLTYNNKNLPFDGVSKRDVQLFLKRFRRNLERHSYVFHIRYVAVAEYGQDFSKSLRPHYHLILWNVQSNNTLQYFSIVNLLQKSWDKGFVKSRLVDMKDNKSFYYTSKYLRKDIYVPPGKNPIFMLSSRGDGGIGSSTIDNFSSEVRRTLNVNYKIVSRWTGKIIPIQWSRYILNRIFPSFSRSVSSRLRKAVQSVVQYRHYLWYKYDIESNWQLFNDKFKDFFYTASECREVFWHNFNIRMCREFIRDFTAVIREELGRMYNKGIDFTIARRLDSLRQRFLGLLYLHPLEYDIPSLEFDSFKKLHYKSKYAVLHY